MSVHFQNDWNHLLADEFKKEYYLKLRAFLAQEYRTHTVYPDMYDIFNALHLTSYSDTKVVIIGQDPYHQPNQAHGLCFSVKEGVEIPPSLQNIYKELQNDLGCYIPNNGTLIPWAKQGVLLLNAVLTVRAHQAASHRMMGWESFTDNVIFLLSRSPNPIVFLLWGAFAQSKASFITAPHHLVLKAPHPSPLSAYRGFFGCKHFSKTNAFLSQAGLKPIDWQIPNL